MPVREEGEVAMTGRVGRVGHDASGDCRSDRVSRWLRLGENWVASFSSSSSGLCHDLRVATATAPRSKPRAMAYRFGRVHQLRMGSSVRTDRALHGLRLVTTNNRWSGP